MKVLQNRILAAFKTWNERKKELEPILQSGTADDLIMNRLQLNHFRKAAHRLGKSARLDEQPFKVLLDHHIAKLEKHIYPNTMIRFLSYLKNRFIDGPAYLKRAQRQRLANMEALKMQLKDHGLGSVSGRLENHLEPELKNISLSLNSQLGPDKRLNLDMHFEKDQYGDFQLNRLDGALVQNNIVVRSHQFRLTDWPNLKADQVRSLLEGRALKQAYIDAWGHANHRWVELGPNGIQHYDPQHQFNIKAALAALPVTTRNKEEMIRYLENGQQVATQWKQNGQCQNIFIQADPAHSVVRLFDARQKPVTAEQLVQKMTVKKQEIPVRETGKSAGKRQHI